MSLNKRTVKWLAASVVLCGFLAVFSLAAPPDGKGGGKGGGGSDAPTLPDGLDVRYRIQFFDMPNQSVSFGLMGTNNLGQIVGRSYQDVDGDGFGREKQVAFLYDPTDPLNPTQAIDLNAIVSGIPDDDGNGVPDWRLRMATAINRWGDIAAYMEKIGESTLTLQAVMIDMNATDEDGAPTSPRLHIVPDGAMPGYSGGYSVSDDMNDCGDIVVQVRNDDGTYSAYVYNFGLYPLSATTELPIPLGPTDGNWLRINNPTDDRDVQVLGYLENGDPFRATLGGPFEPFPPVPDGSTGNVMELTFANDINDAGEFCGQLNIFYPKKIKGRDSERLNYVMGATLEKFDVGTLTAYRLNESGDFVTHQGGLYHRFWKALSPVDMLDTSDPESVIWSESVSSYELFGISDRDNIPDQMTDFPQLFGRAELVNGDVVGFVLTPVPEP